MNKKIWLIIFVILIAVGAVVLVRGFFGVVGPINNITTSTISTIDDFGSSDVDSINNLPTSTIGNAGCNDLRNVSLEINQPIASPFKITGEAKGNWFFEASFPIFLVNWDGLIIAQGVAQAKSDWMTTDYVPFEVELKFTKPDYKNNGAIILKKDNPSGLPQHDASCELPVLFK